MNYSLLEGKTILAVGDEPDVLDRLEDEIREACPRCHVEKAMTYNSVPIPTHPGHPFRCIPDSHSDPTRTPIATHRGHLGRE
ncbi:MAG: hypothetical protein EHM36_05555 [Deltaproteobacteria bacterium]|nr:MAG: hypothetical protein EHM36_05555 [Deltaproteobacteria bacterium]